MTKEQASYLLFVLRTDRRDLEKKRARIIVRYGDVADVSSKDVKIKLNDELTDQIKKKALL